MSVIEQAARRLEELRRAGIEPAAPVAFVPKATRGASVADACPVQDLDRVSRRVDLDLPALAARGFLTPDAPRSRLADEIRAAKRPLLANARGQSAAPVQRANCIMVTSSLPGEGKTFTAINLAMSLAAEVDSRVMLIDADALRPSVLNCLGLPSSRGLLDALVDPAVTLADVVLRTNVEKLSLIPAGTAHRNATELLASTAMGSLVDELTSADPSRILVFDTPPLLAAPETRVLAAHVGQIVLVVEANRTPQNAVQEALEQIKDCPVVMTLLNKARAPSRGSGGYGGYGYGAA